MTNEQLQEQINRLQRELNDLKGLFYKDNYSNLEVFRKKVEFKSDVTIENISVNKTGGTNVIADDNHAVVIGAGGGTITITTKNGIITNIT